MPLTMTPERFEEIRRFVRERQLAKEAAEVDAETAWDKKPAFRSVDEFLAYLERRAAPEDRSLQSRRKRR